MHSDFALRGADEFDAEFLEEMLVVAFNCVALNAVPYTRVAGVGHVIVGVALTTVIVTVCVAVV